MRSASPQRDSRTAQSRSGSWLPPIVGGGTPWRAGAPAADCASQRSTSASVEEELAARPRVRQPLARDEVVDLARAQPQVAGDLGDGEPGGGGGGHGAILPGARQGAVFKHLVKLPQCLKYLQALAWPSGSSAGPTRSSRGSSLLSLELALAAAIAGAAIGLPLGALVAVGRFPGRRALIVVLNALLGLPRVVVGLVVYLLLSRAGPARLARHPLHARRPSWSRRRCS